MADDLSRYEEAAYYSIIKALALSPATWDTEEILTSLRLMLHISDEVHTDCRTRVNNDKEIAELRDLQKRQQGQKSMRPSLNQQPSLAMTGHASNMVSMHPVETGAGRPGSFHMPAPPLLGDLSINGPFAGPGPLVGGPSLPGQLPLTAPSVEHVPSVRPASCTRAPLSTWGGSGRHQSLRSISEASPTAQRPAPKTPGTKKITVTKNAKQNQRFQAAVPSNVDIMSDDLRGYVLERRPAEGSAWTQSLVVGCKKESTGQRLTVAENFGTPVERFTHDVFLRKGKAGLTWRFVTPTQRRSGDWAAAMVRSGLGAGRPVTGGAGVLSEAMFSSPVQPSKSSQKKRKVDAPSLDVPPYSIEARKRAVAAAHASRSPLELRKMVERIHDKRRTLVDQLASLRVRELLSTMSHRDSLEKLRSELDSVRARTAGLQSGKVPNVLNCSPPVVNLQPGSVEDDDEVTVCE